jgi:hypothetical protein
VKTESHAAFIRQGKGGVFFFTTRQARTFLSSAIRGTNLFPGPAADGTLPLQFV